MNRSIFLAIAVWGATPATAVGQNPPDTIPPDSVRLLGGLTVSVARPALTSGGSSSVIIELDSLGSPPAPSMEEVLRAMPLVQIRTNSRGEAQPALRGSEDRQIAILMDGVPLTLGWDHRSDLSIIPLTAARNVTLVRGLSSVLYGPNTLGGVVEVDVARTRVRESSIDPLAVGLGLDETGGTSVSLTGGRLADGRNGQWVIRGGAGFQDRKGFPIASGLADEPGIRPQYLAEDALRLNSDTRRADAFVMARYRSDDGAWGSLSASGYEVERGVPPEAHQDAPRLWRYPEQRRLIAALTGGTGQRETGLGQGDLEASLGVDVGSTLIERFATADYRTVEEAEASDDRVVTARLLGDHSVGGRGELRASATYADVHHDEVLTPGGRNGYRQRLWSLGVETEWRLGAADLTALTLGAALDGADTPDSGDKTPLRRLADHGLRLGVRSLVADGVLVHGGVSRRARFPSLRELYSDALGRFEPNPDLGPEALVGSELGFTATGRSGEIQVVGFHHRLADGIVRRSVVGSDGVSRFQRVNQHEVRSTGLEVLLVAALGDVTATGDVTVQDVKGFGEDGNEVRLEYEPSVVGKLGLDVPLPWSVRGGGDVRFVGAQRCENPEIGALQRLGSSRTVDLSVRRSLGLRSGGALNRMDLSASLRNVLDAVVFDQCGLPQPGRLLRIQLRIS